MLLTPLLLSQTVTPSRTPSLFERDVLYGRPMCVKLYELLLIVTCLGYQLKIDWFFDWLISWPVLVASLPGNFISMVHIKVNLPATKLFATTVTKGLPPRRFKAWFKILCRVIQWLIQLCSLSKTFYWNVKYIIATRNYEFLVPAPVRN